MQLKEIIRDLLRVRQRRFGGHVSRYNVHPTSHSEKSTGHSWEEEHVPVRCAKLPTGGETFGQQTAKWHHHRLARGQSAAGPPACLLWSNLLPVFSHPLAPVSLFQVTSG